MIKVVIFGVSTGPGRSIAKILANQSEHYSVTVVNWKIQKELPPNIVQIKLDSFDQIHDLNVDADVCFICPDPNHGINKTINKTNDIIVKYMVAVAQWAKTSQIPEVHLLSSAQANQHSRFPALARRGKVEDLVRSTAQNKLLIHRPLRIEYSAPAPKRLAQYIIRFLIRVRAKLSKKYTNQTPMSAEEIAQGMINYIHAVDRSMCIIPHTALYMASHNQKRT